MQEPDRGSVATLSSPVAIMSGDCRELLPTLAEESVHCCVTSPPYWGLRDYGHPNQIGLEPTIEQYVETLVAVFREVRRVLRSDGTLWLNLGDSYFGGGYSNHDINGESWKERMNGDKRKGRQQRIKNENPGLKPKDLIGIPWRVAFALQADGWYLRNDIVWHKPSVMPESVKDRCTRDHEYVFLMAKGTKYFFNQEAIKVPASPDSHARYARGRSDNHKYADGGPGGQTIARTLEHMAGVNPKAAQNAKGSRQNAGFSNAVKDLVETRNLRTVWTVPVRGYKGAHFATFPPALVEPCILAGCPEGGIVLDPFLGSGTTAEVAQRCGCRAVGIECNAEYVKMCEDRLRQGSLLAPCP